MANTGIKEYDKLPSVVDGRDIDACRAEYARVGKKISELTTREGELQNILEEAARKVNPKPKKAKVYGDPMVIME